VVTKRKESSKRADLLLRALDCINSGLYEDQDDYMLFGWSSIYDKIDDLTDRDAIRNSDRQSLQELVSDLKTQAGREAAVQRTSLSKPNQPKKIRGIRSLSGEGLRSVVEYATRPQSGELSRHGEKKVLDDLDAFYARKVLSTLPRIVARAARLDEMGLKGVPADVQWYFEEAHQCYLHGFQVACAVLCRAILASALENVCDQKGTIKKSVEPGESYFKALVEKARGDGLLTDDRPEWAIKIRDAGNDAIHNFPLFKQRWSTKRDEILLNTRKVLLDLYSRMK